MEGTFRAVDLNGDGYVTTRNSTLPVEITGFRAGFTGNSRVPAFDLAPPEVAVTAVYVLGSGGFGNSAIPGDVAFDGVTATTIRPGSSVFKMSGLHQIC